MKVDVSCLFSLDEHPDEIVEAQIGDGVFIQKVAGGEWLNDANGRNHRLEAKQVIDGEPFTHRFFVSVDGTTNREEERVKNAIQLIIQAVVLSRIVKPTPIATYGAWVWSVYPDEGWPHNDTSIQSGFYGNAYAFTPVGERVLTKEDANQMAQLWPGFHQFFVNEPQHRRIVRALKYFDNGYHISSAEQRHLTFHAALESLICTREPRKNMAEVTTRLPRFSTSVSNADAKDIYNLCCDIKHAATPIFLSPSPDGVVEPSDVKRFNAAKLLETALRDIFKQAALNPDFAAKLCDVERLKKEDRV